MIEGTDFSETLTRARFEELNLDLFKKTLGPVQKVMKDDDVLNIFSYFWTLTPYLLLSLFRSVVVLM